MESKLQQTKKVVSLQFLTFFSTKTPVIQLLAGLKHIQAVLIFKRQPLMYKSISVPPQMRLLDIKLSTSQIKLRLQLIQQLLHVLQQLLVVLDLVGQLYLGLQAQLLLKYLGTLEQLLLSTLLQMMHGIRLLSLLLHYLWPQTSTYTIVQLFTEFQHSCQTYKINSQLLFH